MKLEVYLRRTELIRRERRDVERLEEMREEGMVERLGEMRKERED